MRTGDWDAARCQVAAKRRSAARHDLGADAPRFAVTVRGEAAARPREDRSGSGVAESRKPRFSGGTVGIRLTPPSFMNLALFQSRSTSCAGGVSNHDHRQRSSRTESHGAARSRRRWLTRGDRNPGSTGGRCGDFSGEGTDRCRSRSTHRPWAVARQREAHGVVVAAHPQMDPRRTASARRFRDVGTRRIAVLADPTSTRVRRLAAIRPRAVAIRRRTSTRRSTTRSTRCSGVTARRS
jgi:hypothetical protein